MSSEKVNEKHESESSAGHSHEVGTEVDLYSLHELHAGRLIIDPESVSLASFYPSQLELT